MTVTAINVMLSQ